MRKTNYLLMTFSVAIITFFSSCQQQSKGGENQLTRLDPESLDGYFCYPATDKRPDVALDYKQIVTMLKEYDNTRIKPLEEALGYEDTRINNYDFDSFIQYLNYIKKLSKKAGIKITGISFISAAKPNYDRMKRSYQDLIYIPTTTIDGKQIPFDPVQSVKQGKLVTFKQALAKHGYNWIYNTKKDFEVGKRKDYNYSIEKQQVQNKAGFLTIQNTDKLSGAGNWGNLQPPFDDEE